MRLFITATLLLAAAFDLAAQPAFEAASIKPRDMARAGGEGNGLEEIYHSPVTLTLKNVSLSQCILWAYDLKLHQISGPQWIMEERFDIQAKAAGRSGTEQFRLMLRALLADRFKLVMHPEQKELAVYELVKAKNWTKPAEAKGDAPPSIRVVDGGFVFRQTSMAKLAERLSDFAGMDRPVIDKTGVAGQFDFTLKEAAKSVLAGETGTVFSLLQEQLGLRLESRKSAMEVLIVDRAERPSAN